MKSIIRNLSAPTEFCLVIFICFGLTIFANSIWIIRHVSHVPLTPSNVVRLNNDGIVVSMILELLTLGIALLIGRIRGWSLTTFGLRPSWKWTGVGALLFFAFVLAQRGLGMLTRMVFHSPVDFHRISHLTIPFIILISVINPIFEEAMESGYFFSSLQRHGMWLTVLAAALFRGFFAHDDGSQWICHHVCDGLALRILLLEMA